MRELNKEQLEAANFLSGICSVIAVPGSGKTLTMTERIGILVKEHGISPESIVGLTFTRNAAKEMRKRLKTVLEDKAERVILSTIHSFCLQILKQEGKAFHILFAREQVKLLRQILKDLRIRSISVGRIIREISLSKSNLLTPADIRDLYEGDSVMQRIADVYEAYEHEKRRRMALDFDDLLTEAHKLLERNQDVREKLQERFQHLMVDEFQDVNPVQVEFLKLLMDVSSGNGNSFWVCGDDWQSIYGFNAASINNIIKFKDTFPEAREFILHVNYRSTPQILKACKSLISHNTRKIDKPLTPHNEDGEQVVVLESFNEEEEAEIVCNEIMDLVERRKYKHKEIAVLYRANFQSRVIEEIFSKREIPYRMENGTHFFKRREVKVLLDYLRLINNADSDEGDEALLNVINIPSRYLGRKFVDELKTYALENDLHLYEALKGMEKKPSYVKENVSRFIDTLDPLVMDMAVMRPTEAIKRLREELAYDRYVTEDDIPSPDDEKVANLNQLELASAKFNTIESFVQHTALFVEKRKKSRNGVVCMTIHKSKGLEWPVVFVVGLVEGIMPTKHGDLEEERRICFVAMSRAQKLLYLSTNLNYLGQPAKKSLFLEEIVEEKP